MVDDKVTAYVHPSDLAKASGNNEGAQHRGGQPPQPPSGNRLEADSVPLEEAQWRHQVDR